MKRYPETGYHTATEARDPGHSGFESAADPGHSAVRQRQAGPATAEVGYSTL